MGLDEGGTEAKKFALTHATLVTFNSSRDESERYEEHPSDYRSERHRHKRVVPEKQEQDGENGELSRPQQGVVSDGGSHARTIGSGERLPGNACQWYTKPMTYYRTVLTVEVLSTTPVADWDLSDIAREMVYGDVSGDWQVATVEEVTEERMSELLIAQGSDPSFLLGDEEDEEDEEYAWGDEL